MVGSTSQKILTSHHFPNPHSKTKTGPLATFGGAQLGGPVDFESLLKVDVDVSELS